MNPEKFPLSDPRNSRVVLVGTSRYTSRKLHDLTAVENNLQALQVAFTRGPWKLPPTHCVVFHNTNDSPAIVDALHHAAGSRDTVIFYYAGHGLIDPLGGNDQLLLALPNSSTDKPHLSLHYSFISRALSAAKAKRKVVILDCCYAGLATGQGDAASLGQSAVIEGTYVLCAAGPTTKAVSPAGMKYTAFTDALLRVHDEGIPDEGPALDMHTVYRRLYETLRKNSFPTPYQSTKGGGGEISFIVNRAADLSPADVAALIPRQHPLLTRRRALVAGTALAAGGVAGILLDRVGARKALQAPPPGSQRWHVHFSTYGLPLAGDHIIFAVLGDGRVMGLQPENGDARWQLDLRGFLTGSSVIKGTVLVSLAREQGAGTLTAVDSIGRKRWTLSTEGWPSHQAAGPNDKIYVATNTGWLYRVDRTTGESDYSEKIAGQLNGVVAANNHVYLSTFREGFIALDPATGAPRWSHPTKGNVPGAAVDSGLAYLTVGYGTSPSTYGGKLVALDVQTGKTAWSASFDSLIQAGPTLAGGQLHVTDNRGTVQAFQASDGHRLWQRDVEADVSSGVTYDGESLYVGTWRGVTALALRTGQVQWSKQVVAKAPSAVYSTVEPALEGRSVYIAYGDRTTSSTDCDFYGFSR
ncbi:PQQ-binding-like beta-propeller repeat protein [Streptomyces sp. NPDC006476]|uniref:caspase, EACC1-associated type n=1 Tax=Streptomyces sp. NPDC006476 TaxID=3157175 RepID=UPI0033AFE22A